MVTKWVPEWFQKVIKTEPFGAHGCGFEILGGFERMCVLDEFFGLAKSRPKIVMISDFGSQLDSAWLFCSGWAGEAACQGGERGGVMLPESI